MKRKTHIEYTEEIAIINPNIEVIGRYINAKTKILHKCKLDGCEWYAIPSNVLNGRGCPICGKIIKATKKSCTHSWYLYKVAEINTNIEVLGIYSGNHNKILHKCKIDGHEWYAMPSSILRGSGCPKCASLLRKQKRRKRHEDYIKEVADINPNIEVVGEYVNTHTKILHRCKIDGYEWNVEPAHILIGDNCPICAKISRMKKQTKSHDEYIKEVAEINPNIEVIEKYINAYTKILHKCKIDGYEWYAAPSNILTRGSCPKCTSSYGERDISEYLIGHKINYLCQYRFDDCKNQRTLPFDFYLPDYNCCIEYDGIQHFEPIDYFGGIESLQATQYNDFIKTQYCENNNIVLLRIKYNQSVKEVLDNFFNKLIES